MKEFDSAKLKMIAVTSMLIDHIGAALIENSYLAGIEPFRMIDTVLRMIGRLSFPLYCFMIVEGFQHTRNKKRYLFRILILALVSEFPFDLAFFGGWNLKYQNVLFTFFIGLIMLQVLSVIEERIHSKIPRLIGLGIIVLMACVTAYSLHTDYSYRGILLIAILYLFRRDRETKCFLGAMLFLWQPVAMISFYFIFKYNGKKGILLIPNWLYQIFYPLHISILWGIRYLIL